ncbi:MAG: hypothetical protein WBG43_05975 [Marinifilaceae bacterium]
MKIKDLNLYIKKLTKCDEFSVWNFEEQKYKLLSLLNGETDDISGVHRYIQTLTDFANDSYDQIFYEMLQNAKDEDASKMFVYYEEAGGILIMNNGNPFQTDVDIKGGDKFKGFLTINKALKYNDDGKSGKYGKGSKLMYNLLIPRSTADRDTTSSGKRLLYSMSNDMKAPILFSWKNRQLKELLKVDSASKFMHDDNLTEDSYSLLCMLLFSYFPLMPNQKVDLGKGEKNIFNNEVYSTFRNFLQRAYDKFESEKLFLDKGTLIYIPSPELVNSEIASAKDKIVSGLEQSFTILSSNNTDSKIDAIYFNDICIKRKDVCSFDMTVHAENLTHAVSFVLNKELKLEDTKMSNIMTDYFPVSEEKYGLGYSLKCRDFDIEDNRQRIKRSNVTLFNCINEEIDKNWIRWRSDENYNSLLIALAISDINERGKEHLLVVHNSMIACAKQYLPTNTGEYKDFNSVVFLPDAYKDSTLLEDFSLDLSSVSADLYKYRGSFEKLGIKSLSISEVLDITDKSVLREYFDAGASNRFKLLKTLEEENNESLLLNIPIIKLNTGEYYSLNDFINDEDSFLCFPVSVFENLSRYWNDIGIKTYENRTDCEFFDENNFPNICNLFKFYWDIFLVKNRLISIFHKDNVHDFRVGNELISDLRKYDNEKFDKLISEKIYLFKNNIGELKVLSEILPCVKSIIATPWQINGDYNAIQKYLADEEDWWEIISSDRDKLEDEIQNSNDLIKAVGDCCSIIEGSGDDCFDRELKILKSTDDDFYSIEDFFITEKMSEFTESEYDTIITLIGKCSYKALKYDMLEVVCDNFSLFKNVLGKSAFSSANKLVFDEYKIRCSNIREIKKWCKTCTVSFFSNFILSEENEHIYISPKSDKYQFRTKDKELCDYLVKKGDYVPLPVACNSLFIDSSINTTDNDEFISELIKKYGAFKELISSVVNSNNKVKLEFINRLKSLQLSLNEDYSTDCFEYKFLEMCMNILSVENVRRIISVDAKPLNGNIYKDKVNILSKNFYLSELLPGKFGDTEQFSRLADCFKDIHKIDQVFCLSDIDLDELYYLILDGKINDISQLYFVSLYVIDNKLQFEYNNIGESLSKGDCLQLFLDEGINFSEIFSFYDFLPFEQIYTERKELLLESEVLPVWLNEWIIEDEIPRREYLKNKGLRDDSCNLINVREILFDESEEKISNFLVKSDLVSHSNWVIEQSWNVDNDCNRLRNLYDLSLISIEQSETYFALVMNSFDSNDDYTLEYIKVDKSYYYYRLNKKDKHVNDVVAFFLRKDIKVFYMHSVVHNKIFKNRKVKFVSEISDYDTIDKFEWDYAYYKKWIEEKENDDIRIYSINELVNNRCTIYYGEDCETLSDSEGLVGRTKDKELLINKSLLNGKDSELAILKDNIDILFPYNKEQLISLMLIACSCKDEQVDILKSDNSNSISKFKGHVNRASNFSSRGSGNVNSNISQEVLSKLDDLSDVIENMDINLLRNFIKNPNNYTKEDQAEINEIVGYIGEALLTYWMKNIKQMDVNLVSDIKPEYDIDVNNGEQYIDVKTNKGYIKEDSGSSPIYVKGSQRNFIKGIGDNKKYNIVRLSLESLGVDKWNYGESELTVDVKDKINLDVERFFKIESNVLTFEESIISFRLQNSELFS